jgi:AsmA-like C-terminal region
MRPGLLRPCLSAARACSSAVATVVLWTFWLLLCLALAVQLYIASSGELQVPHFLLRAIEDHLAESGISVRFGRATFDPTGRVLLQKAKFRFESFAEPVVTAEALYIRLDPWALFERRFEAREIRATGANLYIPAMLSPSGKAERMVQDLDAGFSITSRGDEFSVDYLNCRLGGVSVSAHGTINAGTVSRSHGAEAKTSLPLAEFVALNYVALSKEFSKAQEQMAGMSGGKITAVLTPSDTRGAVVYAELGADSLEVPGPLGISASGIRASTRFPLLGSAPLMTTVALSADAVRAGESGTARALRLRLRGILKVDTLSFSPKQLEARAAEVEWDKVTATGPSLEIDARDAGGYRASASAWLLNDPMSATAVIVPEAREADISFEGRLSPGVEEAISERLRTDIRRFADLSRPMEVSGTVKLTSPWTLASASGHVDTRDLVIYHVPIDEARGDVVYADHRLAATHAFVRKGDNRVYGGYEQDFPSRRFRYLLTGQLRPLDITPWFGVGGWWTALFGKFDFDDAPARASVDVQGRYVRTRDFSVFVAVDSDKPKVLGVPLDRMRTLLYVDPEGCDGLEVSLVRSEGSAQGSFRLSTATETGRWSGFDVEATSHLDPAAFASLLSGEAAATLGTLVFTDPPAIVARGHFDGPAADGDRHQSLHLETKTASGITVHGVALEKASFKVNVTDGQVDVQDVQAGFAGGTLTGSAQLTGKPEERKLRFKASLDGASLGRAAAAGAGYVVSKKPGSATALETFARDKSGVGLDLNISGEGRLGELASFTGAGNFQVQGAQLGEVSLLGGLSKFLKFPELRFTQARAEFKLENASIQIPDLSVIGANSAIKAKGSYAIDRHVLDFTATVYPFQESRSLLQVLDVISKPISAMLTVRLSGSPDKPQWALAYSPLSISKDAEAKPAAAKPATPAPKP